MEPDQIVVRGARQHNLKNVDLSIPRYQLVVLTGVSGSGKSSMAFDTIYAEGQRRYVESLSAYARQFLGQMEKPKVDAITGLSPAIAIEQKAVSKNPRSTVGTVTEVMDYLRVLFARAGITHCPKCGRVARPQSAQQIADQLAVLPAGSRVQLLAPLARNRKGTHAPVFAEALAEGFVRVRVNGEHLRLDEGLPKLDKKRKHNIDLVVDRLVIPEAASGDEEFLGRLVDSVETTLRRAEGLLVASIEYKAGVAVQGGVAGSDRAPGSVAGQDSEADANAEEWLLSEHHACPHCNISFPELSPQMFSFNSPLGMCPDCNGLGTRMQADPDKIIENPEVSIMDGALRWFGEMKKKQDGWTFHSLKAIFDHYEADMHTPWCDLPASFQKVIMEGSGDERIRFTWGSDNKESSWSGESLRPSKGILHNVERLFRQTNSEGQRKRYASYMDQQACNSCKGTRLRPEARGVTVGGRTITELGALSIAEAQQWVEGLRAGHVEAVEEAQAGLPTGAWQPSRPSDSSDSSDSSDFSEGVSALAVADSKADYEVATQGQGAHSGLLESQVKNESQGGSSGHADEAQVLSKEAFQIAEEVLKEIHDRLGFMLNVGLHYLTLDRSAPSLSGGEGQRIRLASQIGCGLVGVLYILDEPSIGLHARDNRALLDTLHRLRDMGNTVLVVEHDEETMRESDWLIDLGPGAGVLGGEIVAAGPPGEVMKNEQSMTGAYLRGEKVVRSPLVGKRRTPRQGKISIIGAKLHNLRSVTAKIPLATFTCVTGVSGSGKSSLIAETLHPALARSLHGGERAPGPHKRIDGLEHLDKVVNITQDPIGRTPRSNPATYVGIFDEIRKLFAGTKESRARGYKPGRFSFNVKGGRCEACQGYGRRRVEMHFLSDVWVICRECEGARFNRDTLAVTYRERSIADVLNMDVLEALNFFEHHRPIARKLQTLHDVGLDYIKLGQSALTLSGGEAQRIKLARELSKVATGRTLYILDEPTTGLHFVDIQKLLDVLHRLVDQGNTVVVIEHNLDVIKTADHLIDLGPEGGAGGGQIIAEGTPEFVAEQEQSHTGTFLKQMLALSEDSER